MNHTETIRVDFSDGIVTLTFDEPNSPVNTMCKAWQRDIVSVTDAIVAAKDQVRGIILASAKKVFFAGADLKGVMRSTPDEATAVFEEIETTKRCFRALETLGIPVVTCLNGHALGGGWELALVGHHRIAIDNPKTMIGLPEVNIGLLPGGTGVTKMVRLLGIMGAQPYVLECKLFSPAEGHKIGLIHDLVALSDDAQAEMLTRARTWIAEHPQSQQPWDVKGYKMPGGDARAEHIKGMLSVAPAMLKKKTRGLLPAPEYALAAMVEGSLVDYDTASRIESRYLARLWTTPVAHNLINTMFFNMNAIKSGASRPKDVPRGKLNKVGILGAGMMGSGIAYAQASKGIATVLKDVSLEAAERGKAYSAKLTQARVDKGKMSADKQAELLARITPTADAADLAGCELIIEAVFENRELKAQVTQEAEAQLADGGFFASNTSTLPISGLAKASRDAKKFIGIHFFSPVDKMQLVEIIRGAETDDETLARAYDYVQQIGKLPIVVNDSRGFYTSRTFGTFVMEGAAMLGEGIPAAVIENAAMQCGMPVGPLAVLDETALSLSVHVLDQTRADYAAEGKTYEASAGERLVEKMVKELGRSGRAAGGGFYDYPAGQKKHLWPELQARFGKEGVAYDIKTIQDRLLFRQAVETVRCLQEGVLTSVHDANIGSIFGIGFPVWAGGAMQFVYGMGIEAFEARAAELAAQFGQGFGLSEADQATIRRFEPKY
jgi:3-hydroxyacyl-CoA dehydrogenase/enoyl-CoA hydratase/3-hydroxybutyryl-CoA epimerase